MLAVLLLQTLTALLLRLPILPLCHSHNLQNNNNNNNNNNNVYRKLGGKEIWKLTIN